MVKFRGSFPKAQIWALVFTGEVAGPGEVEEEQAELDASFC
jgi:hypothetical protein